MLENPKLIQRPIVEIDDKQLYVDLLKKLISFYNYGLVN